MSKTETTLSNVVFSSCRGNNGGGVATDFEG